MADKKKNYAEALKAQMPSKPADPSKETIEVDMDGVVTPIVRGNMTDEQWANVKKRAIQVVKPTSVSYETGGEPTPAEIEAGRSPDVRAGMGRADKADAADTRRRALQQLFENPHYQVGAGSLIPDEDTRDLLKKMPVEKAVDYLEKRLQHQEWKQKQDLENSKKLSDETQPADKTVNPSKPDQGSPSEWDAQKPATTGGAGTQTENDGPYISDAGPGMSVRGNMAQMAMGANSKERSPGHPRMMPEMDIRENPGSVTMPEMDISPDPGAGLANTVREANARAQMQEGLDFSTPESRLAASVKGALRSEPAYKQVSEGDGASISPTITAGESSVKPTVRVRPMTFDGSQVDAGDPAQRGFLDNLNQFATEARGALTDVVTDPMGTLPPMLTRLAGGAGEMMRAGGPLGALPDGAPAPAGGPPGAPGAQPLPPGIDPAGQPSGSMGGSMSMSGRIPGTGGGGKSANYDAELKSRHDALSTQLTAEAGIADKQSELLVKKASLIAQQQDAEAQLGARQAAMETARSERMRQGQVGLATLQARMADLESQSPDPNRYWNDKNAGQKAAAVIAGALFGATGQGMQWLQRLDGLVEADIQRQAAELQRKGGLINKQVDVQNNLVALGRQQGLDEGEAISAARKMMHDKYATQFEAAAATTGSETVKMQALQNAGILRQKSAEADMEFKLKTNKAAQEAALTAAQVNHLNAQTFAARVAAAGGGKDGKQEMKPGQQERLSGLLSLGDQIGEMSKQYKDQVGMMSPVTSNLGLGMQVTDASKWKNSSQKFHAQTIGTVLEGGKLTDADFPKYVEGFIPSAADTSGAAQNKVGNLIKYAVTKYKNELSTLDSAFVRSRNLPTPEEYEASLRKQAQSAPPSYAKEQ